MNLLLNSIAHTHSRNWSGAGGPSAMPRKVPHSKQSLDKHEKETWAATFSNCSQDHDFWIATHYKFVRKSTYIQKQFIHSRLSALNCRARPWLQLLLATNAYSSDPALQLKGQNHKLMSEKARARDATIRQGAKAFHEWRTQQHSLSTLDPGKLRLVLLYHRGMQPEPTESPGNTAQDCGLNTCHNIEGCSTAFVIAKESSNPLGSELVLSTHSAECVSQVN